MRVLFALLMYLIAASSYAQPFSSFPPGVFGNAASTLQIGCTPVTAPSGGTYDSVGLSGWTNNGGTVTANQVVSPTCSTDGTTIVETSGGTFHGANTNQSALATTVATKVLSVYFKRVVGTRNAKLDVFDEAFAGQGTVGVDLSNCTINVSASAGAPWSAASATATLQSNGWCYLALTVTTAVNTGTRFEIDMMSGTTLSYSGDGSSSIGVWGLDWR